MNPGGFQEVYHQRNELKKYVFLMANGREALYIYMYVCVYMYIYFLTFTLTFVIVFVPLVSFI